MEEYKPEFIRVKRRRNADSMNAILLDEEGYNNKNIKKPRRNIFVFKLTNTIDTVSYHPSEGSHTPLLKLENKDENKFILEHHKKRKRSLGSDSNATLPAKKKEQIDTSHEEELPPEISQMVNKYLSLNENDNNEQKRRKPSKKHYRGDAAKIATLPSMDYVYDIYKLEKINEDDEMISNKLNNIGIVKIIQIDVDLVNDEIEHSDIDLRSDDEDSNEENFYKNDYPEDEDDDRSILFGEEGEEIAAQELEDEKLQYELDQSMISATDSNVAFTNSTEEFSRLFRKLEGSNDILSSLQGANVIDMDGIRAMEAAEDDDADIDEWDEDAMDDEEFTRNEFFKTDVDDPMAIHRDKIFAKLQKMIDRKG